MPSSSGQSVMTPITKLLTPERRLTAESGWVVADHRVHEGNAPTWPEPTAVRCEIPVHPPALYHRYAGLLGRVRDGEPFRGVGPPGGLGFTWLPVTHSDGPWWEAWIKYQIHYYESVLGFKIHPEFEKPPPQGTPIPDTYLWLRGPGITERGIHVPGDGENGCLRMEGERGWYCVTCVNPHSLTSPELVAWDAEPIKKLD